MITKICIRVKCVAGYEHTGDLADMFSGTLFCTPGIPGTNVLLEA